jgi:hypothetical protein
MTWLRSVDDVVRVLGADYVRELTGANPKQLWNWTGRFRQFPARTYVVLNRALQRRGYQAPARLWNMIGEDEAA